MKMTDNADYTDKTVEGKLRILDVQEKERQRIAADLHDSSLQNLTHLIHKLELCSLYMDKDMIAAKLELAEIRKELKDIINEIRDTIFNLRPMTFDDLGIQESFQRLKERLQELTDMNIVFDIGKLVTQDQLILMMVFRIVNECATNAVKHSKGTKLEVSVREEKNLIRIIIVDNGHGFDYEEVKKGINGHFGMLILNERVLFLSGSMDVISNAGGTKISIVIPISQEE